MAGALIIITFVVGRPDLFNTVGQKAVEGILECLKKMLTCCKKVIGALDEQLKLSTSSTAFLRLKINGEQ
jgi:hypothetical protein